MRCTLTDGSPFAPAAMKAGIDVLLAATQRARSIALESGDSEVALASTSPWLFGPKSLMHVLPDLAMGVKPLTPGTYRNLMFVAHRFEPSIAMCAVKVGDLPEMEELWVAEDPVEAPGSI